MESFWSRSTRIEEDKKKIDHKIKDEVLQRRLESFIKQNQPPPKLIQTTYDMFNFVRKNFWSARRAGVSAKEILPLLVARAQYAIEASELTKKFGDLVAVDHVNLKVEEGELWGLLGPNGADKTPAVRMLCCLVTPTEGTAKVGGYDVQREAGEIRKLRAR